MQTSDFIASTALVVSIFSIWLQNRGVQKQLLVANISAYTKRYQEIIDKMPKSVLDNNFDLNSLSDDDKEKLLRSVWQYFDLCYEEYSLYHELKLIDKKLWKNWEKAMFSAFDRPAFYQCWNEIRNQSLYPKSFADFVNNKMLDRHTPGRTIS